MTRHYDGTLGWEQWDWRSVHILSLSESSASATLESRFRWVDVDGATHNSRGAWTYVFLKSNGAWKVAQMTQAHPILNLRLPRFGSFPLFFGDLEFLV